jgi:hypothetical protein
MQPFGAVVGIGIDLYGLFDPFQGFFVFAIHFEDGPEIGGGFVFVGPFCYDFAKDLFCFLVLFVIDQKEAVVDGKFEIAMSICLFQHPEAFGNLFVFGIHGMTIG